jgi:hypothetical protein
MAKTPDFIALDALAPQPPERFVLILRRGSPGSDGVVESRVDRDARDPRDAADGVPLDQQVQDFSATFGVQPIHTPYFNAQPLEHQVAILASACRGMRADVCTFWRGESDMLIRLFEGTEVTSGFEPLSRGLQNQVAYQFAHVTTR